MGQLLSRSSLQPRERFVAHRILASTERLVEQVQAEAWSLVPHTLRERRGLLRDLREPRTGTAVHSCFDALHAAVSESERVVLQMLPAEAAVWDS